jgi:sulfatase maturation enzyme AslB (radical SAM superfamily)
MDDEWVAFFKKHKILVALSVDGPRALHDAYGVTRRAARYRRISGGRAHGSAR